MNKANHHLKYDELAHSLSI